MPGSVAQLLLAAVAVAGAACSFTPAAGPDDAPSGGVDAPLVVDAAATDADAAATGADGAAGDAPSDGGIDPSVDAGADASVPPIDAGVDAPPPPPVDAAVDAPPPPPVDAGVDAPPPPPDAAAPTCPGGYVAVDGLASRYRVVTSQYRRWTGAEADCEDDGAGTHLVVLDSAAELALLDARLGETFWVGVSDRVNEGTWRTVTGVPALLPWNSGEPNDILGEDCGEIAGGGLNDLDCGAFRRYVCECDGLPAIPGAY
jgi:hypothetical protein